MFALISRTGAKTRLPTGVDTGLIRGPELDPVAGVMAGFDAGPRWAHRPRHTARPAALSTQPPTARSTPQQDLPDKTSAVT